MFMMETQIGIEQQSYRLHTHCYSRSTGITLNSRSSASGVHNLLQRTLHPSVIKCTIIGTSNIVYSCSYYHNMGAIITSLRDIYIISVKDLITID